MKTFKFNLDLKRDTFWGSITPKQGETGTWLDITLIDDSTPFNLVGADVKAVFLKKDGKVSYIPCTITDGEQGKIKIKLTNQILAIPGKVECEIHVEGTDGLVKSWTFTMDVQKSVGKAEIESSNEVEVLDRLIEDVREVEDAMPLIQSKINEINNSESTLNITITTANDMNIALSENINSATNINNTLTSTTNEARNTNITLTDTTSTAESTNSTLSQTNIQAQTTKSNLDSSISAGNALKTDLDNNISTGTILKNNLGANITEGNQLKTDLQPIINDANTSKTNLETTVNNANTKKIDLDGSISTATTKKAELDNSINDANTINSTLSDTTNGTIKKATDTNNTLNSTIDTANTSKTNLDTSINNSTTTKTDLDNSISTANTIKTVLDGTIIEGNALKSELGEIIEGTEYEQIITDIADLKQDKHNHSNKSVIDGITDEDGKLKYKGQDIGVSKTYVDAELINKIDKEEGKGLSTNDYTDEEKQKNQDNANNILALQQNLDEHKADNVSQGEIHGLRVENNKLEYYTGTEWKIASGGIPVGNVSGLSVEEDNAEITLMWTDPEDRYLDDLKIAEWQGTKIIRKEGSYPVSDDDGALVVDNTIRNQYSTNGYKDTGLTNGVTYYYMAFPYTEDAITVDSANRIKGTPTEIDPNSWGGIQKIVRKGLASEYFSVGDQLVSEYDGGEIVWEVIGIDVDTPADSQFTHSMTLQTKDCLHDIQFDAKEPNNPNSDRQSYGNNRYTHSAVRQWLNSDDEIFNWQPQHQYDATPTDSLDVYNSAGFLYRLDPELVSVLGAVNKKVALNTVTDGGGQDSFSDKVFLLSRVEAGSGTEGTTTDEFVYPYYNGIANAGRIKQLNGSNRNWWLRSPNVSYSYYVRSVYTDGSLDYNIANRTFGVSPACVII